ncbi:MAG: polyhydroxyalkanoic acid system family protein [Deltaproteobacteria bacterium]|nr:polyhydroxyalkanoic acid system family protein [Deltaproteobacteria bacterium]
MASKDYIHSHDLGVETARERLESSMKRLAEKYGLEVGGQGTNRISMKRSGIDALIAIEETEVKTTIELSWVLEKTLRCTIEDALAAKIPKLLKG